MSGGQRFTFQFALTNLDGIATKCGFPKYHCTLDAAMSSGILKAKQKLGVTFNSDTLGSLIQGEALIKG